MWIVVLAVFSVQAYGLECGIAKGFPPYQFTANGVPTGVDVDFIDLFNSVGPLKIKINQDRWLGQVEKLESTDKLDCIFGMEKSKDREEKFLFSTPIYDRYSAVFILSGTKLKGLSDLRGKDVSGDKDSEIEKLLMDRGLYSAIHLRYPKSKFEAMRMLNDKKLVAAVMPLAVGLHLSQRLNVDVEVFKISKRKISTGVAVKKDRTDLLVKINKQIKSMLDHKRFSEIMRKWELRY